MSVQTIAKRSRGQWLLERRGDVVYWVHFIGVMIAIALVVVGVTVLTTPAISTMTTSDPMFYLPANFEVVEGVTNFFEENVGFGGAGGIGSPQVEMSLRAYRENERRDVTHFLTISPGEETVVDYHDFHPEKVIHTSIGQDSPTWGRRGILFGSYAARKGTIEDGKLVLQRSFSYNGTVALLILLAAAIAIAVYITWIRPLLNRLVIDPIFQRLE